MPTIFSYRFAPLDPTFKDLQLQFVHGKLSTHELFLKKLYGFEVVMFSNLA